MNRKCNGCTLCCKLIPVKEINKKSNCKCSHQRFNGCNIYHNRPDSCKTWSCSWLFDPATADLSRPDRSHYVIDPSPDQIVIRQENQDDIVVDVLQIWCDPKHPNAHADPKLRDMLEEYKLVAIVRYNSHSAFIIFPPSRSLNGKWNYKISNITLEERVA